MDLNGRKFSFIVVGPFKCSASQRKWTNWSHIKLFYRLPFERIIHPRNVFLFKKQYKIFGGSMGKMKECRKYQSESISAEIPESIPKSGVLENKPLPLDVVARFSPSPDHLILFCFVFVFFFFGGQRAWSCTRRRPSKRRPSCRPRCRPSSTTKKRATPSTTTSRRWPKTRPPPSPPSPSPWRSPSRCLPSFT